MKRCILLSAALLSGSAVSGCQSETSVSWKPAAKSPGNDAVKSPAPTPEPSPQVAAQSKHKALQPQTDKSNGNKPPWSGHKLVDFELVERSGRKITRADLLGKPAVFCFIFTQCRGPCLSMSAQMADLQKWLRLRKLDVRLVSISVDPRRDTPEVLREYAKNFGADKNRWWFLTGKRAEIFKIIRSTFGQLVYDVKGGDSGFEVAHTTSLMLVDAKGRVVGEFSFKFPEKLHRRLLQWKRTGSFSSSGGAVPGAKS
jgi:cytochrome oxidase Cu insertion factor (SCO1/SenC/PrrC family)